MAEKSLDNAMFNRKKNKANYLTSALQIDLINPGPL